MIPIASPLVALVQSLQRHAHAHTYRFYGTHIVLAPASSLNLANIRISGRLHDTYRSVSIVCRVSPTIRIALQVT